jgi:hypothetical protein
MFGIRLLLPAAASPVQPVYLDPDGKELLGSSNFVGIVHFSRRINRTSVFSSWSRPLDCVTARS